MSRRLAQFLICTALVAALGGLGVWAWLAARSGREDVRELSIKVPPRRIILTDSQAVAIRLDAETQQRLGLVVVPVERTQWQKRLRLLGFTILMPQHATEIRSPWTGILHAPPGGDLPTIGQPIAKGEVLGELSVLWSPSDRIQLTGQLWDVQGLIGEAEAETTMARSAVERLRQVAASALAAKQTIAAAGELAKFEARLKGIRLREKSLQDALATEGSSQRFPFTASQAGQLTEVRHRVGEVVTAGDVMATIYDPSELWVRAFARPGQISATEFPQEALVTVPGFAAEPFAARFIQALPQIDRGQQALESIYCAANPNSRIPVGLQAELVLHVGPPLDLLAVPRSAVLRRNDQRLVYVQHGSEEFVKHLVQVEDEDAERVYVRPSLPPGVRVVRQGAQALLSEEFKESIQLIEEGGGSEQAEQAEADEK